MARTASRAKWSPAAPTPGTSVLVSWALRKEPANVAHSRPRRALSTSRRRLGAIRCLLIQDGSERGENRVSSGVLFPIGEIVGVIEVGRVSALGVLQDGFQLVQPLRYLGFA